MLLLLLSVLAHGADVARIVEALDARQVLTATDFAVTGGEAPRFTGPDASLAMRSSCRVWAHLDAARVDEVLHEDCPEALQPGLDAALLGTRWVRPGEDATGLLALRMTPVRDGSDAVAVLRPDALHPIVRQRPPRLEDVPGAGSCEALVTVSTQGRAEAIDVIECTDPDVAEELRRSLRGWRWSPLRVGGVPRAFGTRVKVRY